MTLSEKFYLDELIEYTGNPDHVYVGERAEKFIQARLETHPRRVQEVGDSVISCPGATFQGHLTLAPLVEITAT